MNFIQKLLPITCTWRARSRWHRELVEDAARRYSTRPCPLLVPSAPMETGPPNAFAYLLAGIDGFLRSRGAVADCWAAEQDSEPLRDHGEQRWSRSQWRRWGRHRGAMAATKPPETGGKSVTWSEQLEEVASEQGDCCAGHRSRWLLVAAQAFARGCWRRAPSSRGAEHQGEAEA